MTLPEYKIVDTAFAHDISSGRARPKHFTWYRGGQPRDITFFTDGQLPQVDRIEARRKIAWHIEPPEIGGNYDFHLNNGLKFDYVISYNRSMMSCIGDKYLYAPCGGCWVTEKTLGMKCHVDHLQHPKTKLLSIIASDKKWTAGHRMRHALADRYGSQIDLFGHAYKLIEYKTEGLCDYMFSIAVENSVCDDYFTEKVIDPIYVGTVPIYWGTKNIGKYFDARGILSFETVEDFGKILDRLSPEYYMSLRESVKENMERAQKYLTAEDWIYENYPFLFS